MSTDKQAARAKKKKSPTASDRKIDKKNMLMVKTQRELDNIDQYIKEDMYDVVQEDSSDIEQEMLLKKIQKAEEKKEETKDIFYKLY